jgi:hypothetical protein
MKQRKKCEWMEKGKNKPPDGKFLLFWKAVKIREKPPSI